ncbi:MAG: CbiX/SirB N-terminal domain-containing protein [Dehalococcoidia bacterium]
MTRAVLLVAHGSHFSPDSSRPVHAHVRRLAERGFVDEVRAAFWREEPSLSRGLECCRADDVTVVPVLVSAGYFVSEVIPREIRLGGRVSQVDGKTVRYTDPIGAHPALATVALRRAEEAGAGPEEPLIVLGHGTTRNVESEKNVILQAERVRALQPARTVAAAFIEQKPLLTDVLRQFEGQPTTIVPLFVADGWHVGTTIREDFGLGGDSGVGSRPAPRIAGAVGTHPLVADVIVEMVAEAAAW